MNNTSRLILTVVILIAALAIWVSLSANRKSGSSRPAPMRLQTIASNTLGRSNAVNSKAETTASKELFLMTHTPKAYKDEAVVIMLDEVRQFIRDVGVNDVAPEGAADLRECYVHSPYMSLKTGMFAVVTTDNYMYSAAIGNKLCYIMKSYKEHDGYAKDLNDLKSHFNYNISRLNTNHALELGEEWLREAHIDVKALNRDCQIKVDYWHLGENFIPLYTVKWLKQEKVVAEVEMLEPEKRLRKMRVNDDTYNLRQSLSVSNMAMYIKP